MEKAKEFQRTVFPAEVIAEATGALEQLFLAGQEPAEAELWASRLAEASSRTRIVTTEHERWSHDSDEEFFADYRKPFEYVHYAVRLPKVSLSVVVGFKKASKVEVEADSREKIEGIFSIFEAAAASSCVPDPPPEPPPPPPTVFVGHGRDGQWRDLKDHLHEIHGYPVEAYETGARAGHTIRDILQSMQRASSFAVLVMTGEDETAEGKLRARQNVVHEIGLFQGTLGYEKAIALIETGVEEFSNMQGIHVVYFDRGNIRSTFGDVLGALRREFSN